MSGAPRGAADFQDEARASVYHVGSVQVFGDALARNGTPRGDILGTHLPFGEARVSDDRAGSVHHGESASSRNGAPRGDILGTHFRAGTSTPLYSEAPSVHSRSQGTFGWHEAKGELTWILNVKIERDRKARTLSMSQALYVTDLLSKYDTYAPVTHSRKYDTPAEEGLILDKQDQPVVNSSEWIEMSKLRSTYMGIVGGLLW